MGNQTLLIALEQNLQDGRQSYPGFLYLFFNGLFAFVERLVCFLKDAQGLGFRSVPDL